MRKLNQTYTLPAKLLTTRFIANDPWPVSKGFKVHIQSGDRNSRYAECGHGRFYSPVTHYVSVGDICKNCLRARFKRWIQVELEL